MAFLVVLEKRIKDASLLRPYSRVLKSSEWNLETEGQEGKGLPGFTWLIGLEKAIPTDEQIMDEAVSQLVDATEKIQSFNFHLSTTMLPSFDATDTFSI